MALIQLNRGSTDPSVTLAIGELFLNTGNGHLWGGTAGGNQLLMGPGSVGGSVWIGDTAPTAPTQGTLWWDSTGTLLYIYYNDGTSSQWVEASNVSSAQAGLQNNIGRNILHNPLFNVQQRGTGSWTTNGAFTADRWHVVLVTDTASFSIVAATDADRAAIGDEAAQYTLQNVFTGNAGTGAYNMIVQSIEGVRRLSNKTIIISFWAKCASGTLKLGVQLNQAFGSGGSPSAPVNGQPTAPSVTIGTAWARYSVSIAMPSVAGKTLGTNGDDSNQLLIAYSAVANASLGNIGVQSGTVSLWGVQLEIAQPGQTQPSSLEKPDPRYDISNCQRFYQVLNASLRTAATAINALYDCTVSYARMRAPPVATLLANGTNVNAAAQTFIVVDAQSGRYEVQAANAGDCAALAFTWALSADL